jgi:hypothetical protein
MSDPTEPAGTDPAPKPKPKPKRTAGRPLGDTIGGILVGFDQQIMRTLPPPHELVHKGSPVRGLSGEGDDDLVIELPARAPAGAIDPDDAAEATED